MNKFSLIFFLLAASTVVAQERILDFQSTVVVNKDRSVDVTEVIKVNVEGYNIKRGIYRDIITTMKDGRGKRQQLDLYVSEVLRNGYPEHFFTEREGIYTRIKIGTPDFLLDAGDHTYTIKYNLSEQVRFFDSYDEVYWNATGNEWMFSIEKASVTVVLPEDGKISQHAAYSGPSGATGCTCTASQIENNSIRYEITSGLNPYEGLTVAVGWQKGVVPPPTKEELEAEAFDEKRGLYYGAIGLLIMFAYLMLAWFRVGRDPKKGAIIPRFTSPEGFSPAACRYVSNMAFDNKSFTSCIVSMAVKGFLVVHKEKGGYRLEKIKEDDSMLSPGEKKVADRVFRGQKSLTLSGSYSNSLASAINDLKEHLHKEFRVANFKLNYGWMIPAILIGIGIFIFMIIEIVDDDVLIGPVFFTSFLSLLLVGFLTGIIGSLRNKGSHILIIIIVAAIPVLIYSSLVRYIFSDLDKTDWNLVFMAAPYLAISLGILLLILIFFKLIIAPTVNGRKRMDEIEGLRMFMEVAEKDRLNMLNPPDKTPQLFEQLLPYAIALSVENAWGKQFDSIIAKAIENNEYRPTWYVGSHASMFRMNDMTSGLSSSLSSAVSSTSTPPSSSSSGSSGGGSSGGGGGGGGGGGW